MEEKIIISWLLGELKEEDDLQMECELLADEEKFNQVLSLQNDLLDRYTNNKLTASQRESFERRLKASPWLQRRVTKSVLLDKYISSLAPNSATDVVPAQTTPSIVDNESKFQSWWRSFWQTVDAFSTSNRYVFASLTLFLLAGSALLLFEVIRLRSNIATLQTTSVSVKEPSVNAQLNALSLERDKLAKELETEQEKTASLKQKLATQITTDKDSTPVLSFILTPGMLRDSGQEQLLVLPTSFNIDLKLYFKGDENSKNLRVEVLSTDDKIIWKKDRLIPKRSGNFAAVSVKLNSGLFKDDYYIVKLSEPTAQGEFEELTSYSFRVVKK
jgi:hypothetical protein